MLAYRHAAPPDRLENAMDVAGIGGSVGELRKMVLVKQSLELTREYPAPGFDSHWAMTISRRRATTSRQWTRPGRIGFGATSCFPNSCRRGAVAMAMVAMARTISNCKLNCRSALASPQRALMVVALN